MGLRKATAAWATMLVATAGVGTGIAVLAADPIPNAGTPVAVSPPQPDKLPPTPTPAEKERAEEDRRKTLSATIEKLMAERDNLDREADVLQRQLTSVRGEELNPHVNQALGAVLTEAELTIFRTELEVQSAEQRVEDHRKRLKEAEAKPISAHQIASVATAEREQLEALERTHRQQTRELAELSARTTEDAPQARKLVEKLAQLDREIKHAQTKAQEAAKKAIREDSLAPVQRQLAEAEADLRRNRRTLEATRNRRDEIVTTLAKNDARKQSTEIERLTVELQTRRELARQMTQFIRTLELEQKGLPVPAASQQSGSDGKLDRVLRELEGLRAEVRRLSEKK